MMFMTGHCFLCGACTCVPDDETLVSYIDDSSPYKPINDDDVLWLRSFRIMGRIYSGTRTEGTHNDDDEDHTEDQSPASFLTGPVRARGSRFQFLRGTAAGVQFGGCTTVSGTGPEELLSVSRENLLDYLSHQAWNAELLVVHTACYDGIFFKVVEHVRRKELPRNTKISGSLNIDNVHACLKKLRLDTAEFSCLFRQDPWLRGHRKSEAELAEEKLRWARKRRVSHSLHMNNPRT